MEEADGERQASRVLDAKEQEPRKDCRRAAGWSVAERAAKRNRGQTDKDDEAEDEVLERHVVPLALDVRRGRACADGAGRDAKRNGRVIN